ncbi:flagellar biosynthetic protein FliO [Tsuneonella sp. CC-YZS046]|uniref:flagellar biosynthetic protein FliO n=1 Tax=Tsuneonella sp. CC-YZS046 TaxID=3042152 RepID=UPI002D78EDA3|nr:flagellar biosynthetic protein FliO [Tsuneonella sp. CC-YZS046]WRO65702.1 flagellar biosynthetic protein FliO [Tsuneonella sp. CC-YZS046]
MQALRYIPGLPALLIAAPALAAGLGKGTAPAIPWARIALAFVFCIALAAGAILLMRKYRLHDGGGFSFPRRPAGQRAIEIVETRRVSQHGDACLLRCHGQDYLFVITPHKVVLLDKLGAQGE